MPPIVVTVVGFPLMLALLVLVQRFVRKLLGATHMTASRLGRLLATAAGAVAAYLFCALLFLVAIRGFGREEMSMRVSVTPSAPAYEAGLRDGDRLLAVNGTALTSFNELRSTIRDDPERPITMQVERDGQTLQFTIQPRDGQIGVAAIVERHEIPLGLAAASAAAAPAFTLVDWLRELTTTELRALTGPVAIIQREPSPWPVIFRLGELGSYAWPLAIFIALVMSRREHRT